MKTKTKKLFLSLFAFASLAITACSGNNGGSSGAGDSSGSVTTSSESSSGSNTSTTSEADVDTNLYVKVDNGEEQTIAYDEDEGTYTIGPVELTTSQVIEIYIKEDGVKQSALDIIDVEAGSAAYLDVDEDEGTVSVTSDGTYTFVFTYDDGELSLAITKEAEPTPVPTKSGIYIRGTVVSGWDVDPNYELEVAESSSDRLAYIEGVTFTVGEFKLGDATWSAGHEWGWEYDSHNTVIGEAAANFKKPNEATNYNIECTVPGTYDLYLKKNNYISIKLHDETPHVFKAYLGSDEITKVPTEDQENPSNKAEFVKNVTAVEGALSVKKDDVAMDIYAVDNVPCAAGTKSFDIVNTGEHKIYVTSEEQVWIVTPDYPTVRNITATFSSTYSWFLGDPNVDIYAYYWGTSIDAGWVKATFTSSQATFELPNEAEGFLLTRCYKGSTLPDWWVNGDKINRIYNKTEDVVLTASNNYEVPVPANNTNNGPVRLIKVTRGSNTFNLYANVQGSGDSTEYYAENISLQAGDKLSAINNETDVPYEITVKDGCKDLYPSTGVVADGQYDVYINVSNQFWIQNHPTV
ncbi:MAG: hypothetical protein E7175_03490 [Erysipelotrichaceae bacterium]|nr:hypothetical protein [Erysipelotrichaceae bacterium]